MTRLTLGLAALLLLLPGAALGQAAPNTTPPSQTLGSYNGRDGASRPISGVTLLNPDGSLASAGGGGGGSSGTVAQGSPTSGQQGVLSQCAVVTGDQSYTSGQTHPCNLTGTGRLKVGVSYSSNVTPAALPSTTTNSALVGCQHRASPVTWQDTWVGSFRCDSNGRLAVTLETALPAGTSTIGSLANITGTISLPTGAATAARQPAIGTAGTSSADVLSVQGIAGGVSQNTVLTAALPAGSNSIGTVSANLNAGSNTIGRVLMTTDATATGSATPVSTTAAAAGLVLKSSAGNLFGLNVVTAGTAGYVLVTNTTAVPADGAVTPLRCYVLAANSSLDLNFRSVPTFFSTGISVSFSTTGCFNKTGSATAYISGDVR